MLFHSWPFRRRCTRPFLISLLFILFLDALLITTSHPQETRHTTLPSPRPKIFIASIFRNNEYMLRLHWSSALVSLIQTLGPENIYVSIVESGSQEDTKGALRDLQAELDAMGVANRVELGETVEEQIDSLLQVPEEGKREGWIFTGRKKSPSGWEVRRIPYLARLRNKAMEPIETLQKEGKVFEKVLWINDVIFTTEDVITLLATNAGTYAAACSLDFSHLAQYYDTFALRDSLGHQTATLTFPFFHSSISRNALFTSPSAIPVQSCWNGMIAFDASPFYSTLNPDGSMATPPLSFRGINDGLAREHLEGSECCLIHADNPLSLSGSSSGSGVYLNALVRVAYNEAAYTSVNPGAIFSNAGEGFVRKVEWPKGRGMWPGRLGLLWGVWRNRGARWFGGWLGSWWEREVVVGRARRWIRNKEGKGEERREDGVMCLVDETQVLFENGWQHI